MTNSLIQKRIFLVAVLLLLSVGLSAFFHSIGVGTVYTHFFYIPIVLSCIWWQNRGIIIAVILGLLLILFHLVFEHNPLIVNDYFRAGIFVIIAVFVAQISALEQKKTSLFKQKDKKLQESLSKLAEEKKKLDTSYLALTLKNDSLEEKEKKIEILEAELEESHLAIKKTTRQKASGL